MDANPYREIESNKPPAIGCRIHYLATTTSTQDVAAQLARDGASAGTVVIAETQSAGRGRKGHHWYSPPGVNLYLTVISRPKLAAADLPRLSLATGVAVAQTLETLAPGLVKLKWPNDIWLNGKKAGGILAQAIKVDPCEPTTVLLGIGLNVNLGADGIPIELRGSATSVRIELGAPCDRVKLASSVFDHLQKVLDQLEWGGFADIRVRWQKLSALTGRTVQVLDGGARYAGKVVGIDEDGALLLETEDKSPVRLRAGEVTIAGFSSP
jgi:BirA family biotin operon repressor/biotin-[acetyl-CoA-carboxylase] ligase